MSRVHAEGVRWYSAPGGGGVNRFGL